MKKSLDVLFGFLLGIPSTIFRGYAISKYWQWFVMSAFPSFPTMSLIGGIGLSMIWGLMMLPTFFAIIDLEEDQDKSAVKSVLYNIAGTGVSLLVGWIWHYFMV